MKSVKIQCPAKINLDLKVLNKREDGFHNIESIMQTISLFDFLTISLDDSDNIEILLSGTNPEIPYNENNLVYKAVKLFLEKVNKTAKVSVFIEKNIPVSAGLAGGSTDAAGALYGLNKLFDNMLSNEALHELCSSLGSDLNVCLQGGCLKASGRGENIEQLPYKEFEVNLIKPINLGVSAKDAYSKFAIKLASCIDIENRTKFVNDLEWAIIDDYEELRYIKNLYPKSIMTGSGSTYYSTLEHFIEEDGFWVKNGFKSIDYGVKLI